MSVYSGDTYVELATPLPCIISAATENSQYFQIRGRVCILVAM